MKSDAAPVPVKTADPGHKLLRWHSQKKKKKRYLNSPARQFTDIVATISKQHFAFKSASENPTAFPLTKQTPNKGEEKRKKFVRRESLYIEKWPTIHKTLKSIVILRVGLSRDRHRAFWLARRDVAVVPSGAGGRVGIISDSQNKHCNNYNQSLQTNYKRHANTEKCI